MSEVTNDEFARRMMLMAEPVEAFKPSAVYDSDGDCIEFLAKPDAFYAERVDDLLTVYYSQSTNEVVGSLVKGVRVYCQSLLERYPGFRLEVKDGRVRLEHVFLAKLWSSEAGTNELTTLTYRRVRELADATDAEADLNLATC